MKLVVSAGPYTAYGKGGKAKDNGKSESLFGTTNSKDWIMVSVAVPV